MPALSKKQTFPLSEQRHWVCFLPPLWNSQLGPRRVERREFLEVVYECSISCKAIFMRLTFALLQQRQVTHKIWLYFLVVLLAKVCGSDACFTIVKCWKHSFLGQSGQMLRIRNWNHEQNLFQIFAFTTFPSLYVALLNLRMGGTHMRC